MNWLIVANHSSFHGLNSCTGNTDNIGGDIGHGDFTTYVVGGIEDELPPWQILEETSSIIS